jgi:hypothetical protein
MKRMLTLAAILMAVGMSASLAVADMNSSRVPPKGTEGPDISAKVEPKSVEGPDVRYAPSPTIPNFEGIVTR